VPGRQCPVQKREWTWPTFGSMRAALGSVDVAFCPEKMPLNDLFRTAAADRPPLGRVISEFFNGAGEFVNACLTVQLDGGRSS
jgi:hypothetical protein